jgi:hypothetical protein
MHDQPNPAGLDPALELGGLQHTLLQLLLTDDAPGLWSTREIAVAMGDELIAADAIGNLQSAGLAHVVCGFVFPTRAAAAYRRLEEPA